MFSRQCFAPLSILPTHPPLSLRAESLCYYRAASQVLASLAGHAYTRRAWKKETLELFMESGFTRCDEESLQTWRPLIDALFTHDRSTAKDMMGQWDRSVPAGCVCEQCMRDMYERQMYKRYVLEICIRGMYERYV